MKLFLSMTKPSLLSSLLLFGVTTTKSSTTAADQRQPQHARFGRSMQKHSSASAPLQRIREVNNVMSAKSPLRIDDWSESTSLRHRRKLTNKPPMFSDVLDAELEAMSLSMSMSLPSSFNFYGDVDMPSIITNDPISAATPPPPPSPLTTTPPPTSEHSDESHYVKIMFDYLSECAGLELDTDTCLVSSTIDEMLTFQMDMGRRRFLHTRSLQSSNDCAPPPMTEQIMGSIMMLATAKGQCPGISADEYNTVLDTFMGVFAATECWESLCDPGASFDLLIRILFEDAAQCAGVELGVHKCVYDNIIDTFAMTNALPVRRLRRVLEHDSGESNPCTGPSETEMNIFVSTLLNDAKDKCIASGVDLEPSSTYWESVSSDLVNIFSSPTCWGLSGCQVEEESTVPMMAESIVEGEVRSIHVPSTTTTTPSLPTDGEDVPTFDDPTIDAKHDNVIVGDKSKVHNAVFIAVAAGGLVAIAALVVGLRRRRSSRTTTEKDVASVDGTSTDGSSACNHTADLSSPMSSSV